jgi:hypothetical protein
MVARDINNGLRRGVDRVEHEDVVDGCCNSVLAVLAVVQ